ncbi:MAG: cytidylate kinase-like family protein [Collinsella sp.]|nr:cytidylate kinase-like family protein [Collinsella sp.]
MGFFRHAIESRVASDQSERAGQPVVITIARDFGAEGHEIGKMLSNELGIPLYDNELLVRSSIRAGESIDKMADYDEQMAAEFMAFLPDRVDSRTLSDKLFRSMSQVILDLGATKSCIIEGRLSDYLLRHNPNHIAVLVTAPFDDRVEIVRSKRGLNKRQGAKLVRQMQRARELFYKRYSAGKWKMSDGKDIVVNRAKLGRQGCVDVIAAAYYAKLRELGVMVDADADMIETEVEVTQAQG